MGVLDGGFGEQTVNSFAGHSFGWRRAAGAQECSADDLCVPPPHFPMSGHAPAGRAA